MMPSLPDHIELHCGRIHRGWSGTSVGEDWPFQIIEMRGGSLAGISVFSTLGLSKYPLLNYAKHTSIQQELIFVSQTQTGERNIPALLLDLGTEAVNSGRAYTIKTLVGPRQSNVVVGTGFSALYLTTPGCLPDSFGIFNGVREGKVFILWAIPVFYDEAAYIQHYGGDKF